MKNCSTCGQGARKSAAKTALFRAPLALTVSINLSASDAEQCEIGVGEGGGSSRGRGVTVKVWNHFVTNSNAQLSDLESQRVAMI